MLLKIAICDDEKIICRDIKSRIDSMPRSYHYDICIFNDGNQLLRSRDYFDIIFLDIDINDTNGIDIAHELRSRNIGSYIVFLTSHTEYMQEAFKVNAFRYLCKPVSSKDFEEAIHSAEKQILGNESIMVRSNGDVVKILKNDIVCIEAFGDGTFVYTETKTIETRCSLKHWSDLLDQNDFFQTHKSFLVSLRHVQTLKSFEVFMSCKKDPVPVSHRKMKQFKDELMRYMEVNI